MKSHETLKYSSRIKRNRRSSGFIVTMPRTGRSGVQTPVQEEDFSLLQTVHTASGVHPASYTLDIGIVSRG
jgi:hypothetical protein